MPARPSVPTKTTAGCVNARGLGSLPLLTLTVAAAAIALQFVPDWLDAAAYDRAAIAGGEVWRLATGHLTHWNFDHLAWDALMFVVLGAVIERRSRREWLVIIAGSAAAISLWLWGGEPGVAQYRGLSGLDSALFTAVAIRILHEARRHGRSLLTGAIGMLLIGFGGKIGYEYVTGGTLFVDSSVAGFAPLPAVHAVGAAVGVAVVVADRWLVACRPARAAGRAGATLSDPFRGEVVTKRSPISAAKPLVLDIGGEGRHPAAWNLNPRMRRSFGPECGEPIPRLICGRGDAIPLRDGCVDVLLVERTPLRLDVLREILRVARPSATVVLRHVEGPLGDPHRVAVRMLKGTRRQRTTHIGRHTVRETVVTLFGLHKTFAIRPARSSASRRLSPIF